MFSNKTLEQINLVSQFMGNFTYGIMYFYAELSFLNDKTNDFVAS